MQVLPPSQIKGQKAHFPRQSAPSVPDLGTEGAFPRPKCSIAGQIQPKSKHNGRILVKKEAD